MTVFRPSETGFKLLNNDQKMHFEKDGNFLWRIKGHYTSIVIDNTTHKTRAATKTDVTT